MGQFPARPSARVVEPKRQPQFTAPESKSPATGYPEPVSGSGLTMPTIKNARWERNGKGGLELWHVPPDALLNKRGQVDRAHCTYLGVIGKRRQAELAKLSSDELAAVVIEWAKDRAAKKGIEL